MLIGVDKAQQQGKHDLKHNQIVQMGHELIQLPIPVGDYIIVDETIREIIKRRGNKLKKMDLIGALTKTCDSKNSMQEIYLDIIGSQHERFRDECILAQQNGIELIVLIESAPEVKCLEDVQYWRNWKQLYSYCRRNKIQTGSGMMDRIAEYVAHGGQKPPVNGEQLYKTMVTMTERYGVQWDFCDRYVTGRRIVEILTG